MGPAAGKIPRDSHKMNSVAGEGSAGSDRIRGGKHAGLDCGSAQLRTGFRCGFRGRHRRFCRGLRGNSSAFRRTFAGPDCGNAVPGRLGHRFGSTRGAEPHRTANPRGAVFNDAQIASVKQRLNLTPSQERMWPPVEAALRELAYKKPAAGAARPTLDPNSPEVARLKSAAMPLVMSFSFEQQRELRTLAHLIGLGSMVAQF